MLFRSDERVLQEFLERVDQVNSDAYFLARVSRVVLFGSYLRPELDRLGDIDIAVELRPKESDYQRVREATERRLADLADRGRRVAGLLARESWWGGGVAFPEGAESRDQPARLRRREGTHRCGPSPGDLPGCKATEEQAEEEIDPDAPKRGVVLRSRPPGGERQRHLCFLGKWTRRVPNGRLKGIEPHLSFPTLGGSPLAAMYE